MKQKIEKGYKFGDWTLKNYLGEGGNGFVWLAQNSCADNAAIKILAKLENKNKDKVYTRFTNEVSVIRGNSDLEGLLPIIDFYLPDEITEEYPWYVMPIAQPIKIHLERKNLEVIVKAILEIGKILTGLHERGISHRDIKPANLLIKDGKYYIGDFGLVDYPNKLDLTSTGEQIGAKWTIAPEMKRQSKEADGKPADVYSLSKTLWILITGQEDGFDGQYDSESINGLNKYKLSTPDDDGFNYLKKIPQIYTKPLDDLLRDSTCDDPSKRPNIKQFVERLSLWLKIYKDYKKRNPLQWQEIQAKLFPNAIPQRAIWENISDIVRILDFLGSIDNLNHMLLPGTGGMDMLGAKLGIEPDTIELTISVRMFWLVKPKQLIFEGFGYNSEWNYFRLETGDLKPTGIDPIYHSYEALVETRPGDYISCRYWYEGMYKNKKLPPNSRLVNRFISGDFVIFQKTSTYNRIPATYDGRHSQMTTDEFRDYISEKIQIVQQMSRDKKVEKFALEKGLDIDDFILAYLRELCREEYLTRFRKDLSNDHGL